VQTPSVESPSVQSPEAPAQTDTSAAPSVADTIVLSAEGISSFSFGSPEEGVVAYLTRALGAPAVSSEMGECEAAAGYWQDYATFGDLRVRFGAQDDSSNSPRFLATWTYTSAQPPSPPLALDPGIPFGLTLDELQAQYPAGPGMDNMGAWMVGNVWIIPGTPDYPEVTVTGGDIDWCT